MQSDQSDILRRLSTMDIESLAGSLIENYIDHNPFTAECVPILERFLASSERDNRSAALFALLEWAKQPGYAADAILLHFDSRGVEGEEGFFPGEIAPLRYLSLLANGGDRGAARTLALLMKDPYVQHLLG